MERIIFDSHAHYDDDAFDTDRHVLLASLPENGVFAVVNAASDLKSAEFGIKLSEKYPFIYSAVGIHPHEAKGAPVDYIEKLKVLAGNKRVVAIGETGLDYHYDFSPREVQKEVFKSQLLLARNLNLPVIIHDREAHGDLYEILGEYTQWNGVIHCFSGSPELAEESLKLGFYIGLGGAVTFKNAKKPLEVARVTPLERILLETDAPYMAPVPHRGKRCNSSMIPLAAEKIAAIKGITAREVLIQTKKNAENLFKIKEKS